MWAFTLGLTLTGVLCLFSFLMSVDTPILQVLGYLFGIAFVIIYEERLRKPSKKDTRYHD